MNLHQTYSGGARYYPDYELGAFELLVAITCRVGDLPGSYMALLDTASRWCVLPPNLARDLGYETSPDPAIPRLHTRFGFLNGRLERIPLHVTAALGEEATIDATWFISEGWPGPLVLGWKGGLERFRFATDPAEDAFYFAEL